MAMLVDTDRQRSADLDDRKGVQPFNNPIHDEDGSGSSEGDNGPTEAPAPRESVHLVDIPSAVSNAIQLTLGGPGSPSPVRARVWAAGSAVALWVTGALCARMFQVIDPALGPSAIVWPTLCFVSGCAWGASVHLRWRAFCVVEDRTTDVLALQRQGRLMDLLQQDQLPANQVAKLVKATQLPGVFSLIVWIGVWVVVATFLKFLDQDGLLEMDILVGSVVAIVFWPFMLLGLSGGVLLDYFSRVVVVEHVRPIIERVRSSTPADADFDALLTQIVGAQKLAASVGAKLGRAIVLQIVGLIAAGTGCMFVGLTAHPARDHWWRTAYVGEMYLAFGAIWFISSTLMLYQASRVTSVCDTLGDSITEMTETQREPGETTLRMPTNDQFLRIEHLRGYVRGLNRGRGMGFVIHRKRINHTFVVALAVKVISVMTISFPVILSLARVEQKEDEVLNITSACVAP
jgi:hypothetical protein